MAKLKTGAIVQADLIEYLDSYSDFSFEVRVLKTLIGLGFSCDHAGSYSDRTTGKDREFDIRATKVFGKWFLRLAVECKNLRENYPLLVSCLPRREEEAFHDIIVSVDPEKVQLEEPPRIHSRAMLAESKAIRLTGEHTLYKVGQPVGKTCDQVGRGTSGEIVSDDSDVYAKWSQALGSADDLTYRATRDGMERTGDLALSLVFPLLVVPNGRLWVAQFDETGARTSPPTQVERCSYFVNLSYSHNTGFGHSGQDISHLEFVTEKGLFALIDELCGTEVRVAQSFPVGYVQERIAEHFSDSE
jgi:hypothetical protein